ncbi:MAG: UDP-N-acetylmuramate dehydrogenase [Prevotella sp.]
MKINYNAPIPNTFGIKALCDVFLEPENEEEIVEALHIAKSSCRQLLITGEGSNLLFVHDFRGAVIHPVTQGISAICRDNNVMVTATAGVRWDELVKHCVEHGWHGLENLSLIPGTVGASAVQNIGAYGVEAKDVIASVGVVDIQSGSKMEIDAASCGYAYRSSNFKHDWKGKYLVTHVTYRLSPSFVPHLDYGNIREVLAAKGIHQPAAADVRNAVIEIRTEKLPDPQAEGNAGSFFLNPVIPSSQFEVLRKEYPAMPFYNVDGQRMKIPAAWLIDQCGWKGKTLGAAGVHHKQALVLVNRGGATGGEIMALCDAIVSDVRSRFGIVIHPEVNVL